MVNFKNLVFIINISSIAAINHFNKIKISNKINFVMS